MRMQYRKFSLWHIQNTGPVVMPPFRHVDCSCHYPKRTTRQRRHLIGEVRPYSLQVRINGHRRITYPDERAQKWEQREARHTIRHVKRYLLLQPFRFIKCIRFIETRSLCRNIVIPAVTQYLESKAGQSVCPLVNRLATV